MNKSLLFYIFFLFCTLLHVSPAHRDMEHHCQAEPLKQQDVPGNTASNNAAEAQKTTDARGGTGTQAGTDANITADSPVNTDAKITADTPVNADAKINTDTPVNADVKITADITDKWASLLPLEFDILPKNRGLTAPHYPSSNENRIDLFYDSIKNLGGGYVGVGTDQNFTFIAWARSEYAYLMDFDPVVVGINRIHLHFIDISPDYKTFRNLWIPKDKRTSLKIIRDRFQKDPDYTTILKAYYIATGTRTWSPVPERLRTLERLTRRHTLKTFVDQPADYDYIRTLVKQGRIRAVPGNLNGTKTLMSINDAVRSLGVPIRVLYTSNAEDYFRSYTKEFRQNICDIPVDEKGILIRTCSVRAKYMGFPEGELIPAKPYHYNVQPLKNMQEWMKIDSIRRVTDLLSKRTSVSRGLSMLKALPEVRNDTISKGTPAK
jgi:hypothetical protein